MMDMWLVLRNRSGIGVWLILCSVLLAVGGCQVVPSSDSANESGEAIAPLPSLSPGDESVVSPEENTALAGNTTPKGDTSGNLQSSHSPNANEDTQALALLGDVPPELVPATTETARLPQVQQGRTSPFDSLPTTPYIVRTPTAASPTIAPNRLTPASIDQAIPTVPVAGTPPTVMPVPLSVPPSTTNIVPVPLGATPHAQSATSEPGSSAEPENSAEASTHNLPPSSPTLEFTGVLQLGDRISLIVKEPGAASSRYVYVGDAIANGQFVIKAVDFSRGPTPAVILDQAGTESIHWVGSSIGTAPGI